MNMIVNPHDATKTLRSSAWLFLTGRLGWFDKALLTLVGFISALTVSAQYATDYTPRETYNANSKELISSIRTHLQDEIDRIRSRKKSEISHIYLERTNYLIGKVRQEVFIKDDTLQLFVDQILKRIISNNVLYHPPKRILILKSPEVNAFCYLEGTFVIHVGLISKVRNESELAFAIAHELAHFELDHLRKRITKNVETKLARNVDRNLSKVYEEDVTLAEIDSLKRFVYDLTRHNREAESEADSLGFILFQNAGYHQPEALDLLAVLDSANYLKHPIDEELFTPFYSAKFPFQSYWLNQRPRIFSKKTTNTFIFSNDSILSHPDTRYRKINLEAKMDDRQRPLNFQDDAFVNAAITMAEFETIESAYNLKQYDRCLFYGLGLVNHYPHHKYLVSVITRVLIDVYELKEDGTLNHVVPAFTSYYSEELRRVNNFIHNLTKDETGEIAFNFLNNQANFDPAHEEHYYLLWKICKLTQRTTVAAKVEQSYKSKFPKGKFADRMK